MMIVNDKRILPSTMYHCKAPQKHRPKKLYGIAQCMREATISVDMRLKL